MDFDLGSKMITSQFLGSGYNGYIYKVGHYQLIINGVITPIKNLK